MKADITSQVAERHYLTPLFEPGSVAIVGASEKEGKVGAVLLSNMLAAGFRGALFAVNPKYASVQGVRCYASVGKLPERVDLAVIATPAQTVPRVIDECGHVGIRAAVVITAGFSETGPEGARLEHALLDAARRNGVRLVGPNCLGILRPDLGLNATFARGTALAGSLGLVSQSGAVCVEVFRRRLSGFDFQPILGRFEQGFAAETSDLLPASELLAQFGELPGLSKLLERLGVEEESPGVAASAIEFALEGLHLSRRLNKDGAGRVGASRYSGGTA